MLVFFHSEDNCEVWNIDKVVTKLTKLHHCTYVHDNFRHDINIKSIGIHGWEPKKPNIFFNSRSGNPGQKYTF